MDWVAVGLCADVPAGTVVPRKVQGTDLAVWCSANGLYHVWGDRCPHRGMRLSHGFVRGENLSCIYHGWQYGVDGGCTYIPAHPDLTPPKSICVQGYRCQSDGTAIWFALHDTDAKLPDLGFRQAVRTVDIGLPADAVASKLGHGMTSLISLGGLYDLAIALQPSTDNSCLIPAFAGVDQDRKDVSRHLEQMRMDLEHAP